ncbi:MAG: hypothetical protein ABSA23_05760 [Anaerolineales bacterium]|jgi:hypothetical protein
MSGHYVIFILGVSLALAACIPLQTSLPSTGSASPTAALPPVASPTPIPQGGSATSPQQVTSGAGTASPYAPRAGDEALARAGVFLDSATILVQGSNPAHYFLDLKGNLPTPCHTLRVKVNPPDATNRIMVEVYSLADPNKMCAEVLKPFEQDIDLGGFPTGHYTVYVNGRQVGEFDA